MNEIDLFENARNGDIRAKEKIVNDNQGLVWSIARRYIGRGYDIEEIYQVGYMGLIKAMNKFDGNYNVKFSTYAVPLITGEIKRFFRDNGPIKVSRTIKQNGYRISKVCEEFYNKFGREMTLKEISDATGMSNENIVEALDANKDVESLQQISYGKDGNEIMLIDCVVEENSNEEENKLFNKVLVDGLLNKLSGEERQLIYQRYYCGRTQSETAKGLGLTQVQVSRLEKKLLKRLKSQLDG